MAPDFDNSDRNVMVDEWTVTLSTEHRLNDAEAQRSAELCRLALVAAAAAVQTVLADSHEGQVWLQVE